MQRNAWPQVMTSHKFISRRGFGKMNMVAGDKPADPINLAAVMTSTCGGIGWGGQRDNICLS